MHKTSYCLKIIVLAGLIWGLFYVPLFAGQPDKNLSLPSQRNALILSGITLTTLGTLYLFADQDYYQTERVSLHLTRNPDHSIDWFDNHARGMDKFGHVFSSSLFSENFSIIARRLGYSKHTSQTLGVAYAIFILSTMELWDGHFKGWGFSPGDFVANLVGACYPFLRNDRSLFNGIDYKLSYEFRRAPSKESQVHDYARMTFWLTFNGHTFWNFIKPRWLNLALGVGLDSYQSQRRTLYVAPDVNLKKIHTSSPVIKEILRVLDRFHLPLPALQLYPKIRLFLLFI